MIVMLRQDTHLAVLQMRVPKAFFPARHRSNQTQCFLIDRSGSSTSPVDSTVSQFKLLHVKHPNIKTSKHQIEMNHCKIEQ